MNQQITYFLIVTVGSLVFLLLWAISIAVIYSDTQRRQAGALETIFWIGLGAVLPLVGLMIYGMIRLIARLMGPAQPKAAEARQRITQPMNLAGPETSHPTIPAVSMADETIPAVIPVRNGNGPAARPNYSLVVMEGPCAGEKFDLRSLPATIGRGDLASIRLDCDRGVSRQHAEIYDQQGVLRIRDLHSLHGTHVNGFTIEDKTLDPGDRIEVGLSVIKVEKQGTR